MLMMSSELLKCTISKHAVNVSARYNGWLYFIVLIVIGAEWGLLLDAFLVLPQWLVPRGQWALRVSFAMVEAVGDAEDVEGKENIYFEKTNI